MSANDRTTITLKKATRDRLDRIGKEALADVRPTHQAIVEFLVDRYESDKGRGSGRAARAST